MIWNKHSKLRGTHATFSPSQTSYSSLKENLQVRFINKNRASVGTEIHEVAFYKIMRMHKVSAIKELIYDIDEYIFRKYYRAEDDYLPPFAARMLKTLSYIPKEVFESVKLYINDAISYKMNPEVILYYNNDIYGCADCISFSNNLLRIHDLKTGSVTANHFEQLINYAALFCLEENLDPSRFSTEVRIYKSGEVMVCELAAEDIKQVMKDIVDVGKQIEAF